MNFSHFLAVFKTILPRTGLYQQLLQKSFLALSISLLLFTLIGTKTLALLPSPWIVIDGVSNHREREVATAWISEVQSILNSKEFYENLTSLDKTYPFVYLRDNIIGTVSDVADIITLRAPNLRAVRTPMAIVGGIDTDYAFGGWTGDPLHEGDSSTSLTIGRTHLKRYFSQNQVEKSCAINTLAHELSHLIVTDQKLILHALTDTGITPPSRPINAIASYLIGTTAQCTWLEKANRLEPKNFPECVAIFGTLNFNSLRCNQFNNTSPLQLRPSLPPAAKPSWER